MKSYTITKKQYNYLLPVFGLASGNSKMLARSESFFFIGSNEEYKDMLERCLYLD